MHVSLRFRDFYVNTELVLLPFEYKRRQFALADVSMRVSICTSYPLFPLAMHLRPLFLGTFIASFNPVYAVPTALKTTDLVALDPSIEERQDTATQTLTRIGHP